MFVWLVTLCSIDQCTVNDWCCFTVRLRVPAKRPVSHWSPLPTPKCKGPPFSTSPGVHLPFQCTVFLFSFFFTVSQRDSAVFLTVLSLSFSVFLSRSSPQTLRPSPLFLRFLSSYRPRVHRRLFLGALRFEFFCILSPSNKILALGDKCDRLGPSAASLFLRGGLWLLFLATKCANPPMLKGEWPFCVFLFLW